MYSNYDKYCSARLPGMTYTHFLYFSGKSVWPSARTRPCLLLPLATHTTCDPAGLYGRYVNACHLKDYENIKKYYSSSQYKIHAY